MRTGRSTGFGKLTREVRARVPEDTGEGLTRLAALAGVPEAEYVRDVLMCHVHGQVTVINLRHISARHVGALAPECGRE